METNWWDVTIAEATQIKKRLQKEVAITPLSCVPRSIAGADISCNRFSSILHAAVVVLSYPDLEFIETAVHTMDVRFPYVPGYLSFREVPVIVEAYKKLTTKPDLLVADGHGIAHPRALGVATHLGLALDIPTIGCAKSKLFGDGTEPAAAFGATAMLVDPRTHKTIGAYVRTKPHAKPIVVSAGHRITLTESIDIMLASTRGYRIPEPTRRAHECANEHREAFDARAGR